MLNHIHLVASTKNEIKLSDVMRDFKRHTSKQIAAELEKDSEKLILYVFKKAAEKKGQKGKYKVWTDEYHPEAIYSEKWFYQKMEYIHNNPVRKGFVVKSEDWKYSSARNWILDDHSVLNLDVELLYEI